MTSNVLCIFFYSINNYLIELRYKIGTNIVTIMYYMPFQKRPAFGSKRVLYNV